MISRLRNGPIEWASRATSTLHRISETPFDAVVAEAPNTLPGNPSPTDEPVDSSGAREFEMTGTDAASEAVLRRVATRHGMGRDPDAPNQLGTLPSDVEDGLTAVLTVDHALARTPQDLSATQGVPYAEVDSLGLDERLQNPNFKRPAVAATSDAAELPMPAMVEAGSDRLSEADAQTASSPILPCLPLFASEPTRAPHIQDATRIPSLDTYSRRAVQGASNVVATGPHAESGIVSFEIREEETRSVETVNVPWRLLAHMVLSQQGRLSMTPSTLDEARTLIVENALSLTTTGIDASCRTDVPGFAQPPRSDDRTLPAPAMVSMRSTQNHAPSDAGTPDRSPLHANAAVPWALRLVRWASEHASDTSVWLRDYTIDEEAASELLKALQMFAKANGVQVTRMMFNGRELWSAPDT